jgi:calnexin
MSKALAVTLAAAAIFTPHATQASSSSGSIANKKGLFFHETFDEGDVFESGKWIKSHKEKYNDQPILIKPAMNCPPELLADKGIELTKEMKFYGFGSKFPSPLVVKDQDLVVQYEFKADPFQCGGAYVKLPQASVLSDFEDLDNDTPYTIMFGPDRCGSTNKVHFILQHQNPITKKWEEKHFIDAPAAKTDANTHLYTLHLRKDNSFAIYIDKVLEKEGNLLTSMEPAVNPPQIIDDPTDKKPSDWVDEAKVIDPDAKKPDDWDESQPATIPDTSAVKPAGWLDDVEPMIDDPESEKPADWDDEEVKLPSFSLIFISIIRMVSGMHLKFKILYALLVVDLGLLLVSAILFTKANGPHPTWTTLFTKESGNHDKSQIPIFLKI